jgi:hypothetical protein
MESIIDKIQACYEQVLYCYLNQEKIGKIDIVLELKGLKINNSGTFGTKI